MERSPGLPSARAAVLCFISADAEADFELAGLDDDKAVLDAVLNELEAVGIRDA